MKDDDYLKEIEEISKISENWGALFKHVKSN
jgi:hypothetical protein